MNECYLDAFCLWKYLVECYLDAFVFFTFEISFIKKIKIKTVPITSITILLSLSCFTKKWKDIIQNEKYCQESRRDYPE